MNNYVQGSAEWLAMRKDKIMASDAPVIDGVSPYATPYKLWEQKLGLATIEPQSFAMRRGLALEDQARQELEKKTGLFFLPQVVFHKEIKWMGCSLDGIDPEGRHIAEIKCPNKEDHSIALSGRVPEKYIPQLQHQMEVCQVDMSYYFSFDGKEGVLVIIYRDDNYIKKLIKKEENFWECLQSLEPPELIERDFIVKTDQSWCEAASEWNLISRQLKELEAKEKAAKESLVAMSSNQNCIGAGVKLSRVLRKGNVDYSAIPELKSLDLENYRKKSSVYYKLSIS